MEAVTEYGGAEVRQRTLLGALAPTTVEAAASA
jgi:hypothetical protein